MAKTNTARKPFSGFPEISFLRWQMTADEKKKWATAHKEAPFANLEALEALLLAEYKISASYDANNDTYIATITCKADNKSSPNAGCAFGTRAKSALEALDMALYKHYHCCHKEIWARGDDDTADIG